MTWLEEAQKHANKPHALVEIDLGSGYGIQKHSVDFIRPTNASPYDATILQLPRIYQSIGDIRRSFEMSNIEIIFTDTDRSFRTLIDTDGFSFKNKLVTIKMAFPNRSLATESLTRFVGWIYSWKALNNLQFKLICEQRMKNLDTQFPDRRVELGDYPNAHSSARGWSIPIIFGTISGLGETNDGACGHPSLDEVGKGGMLFVDNTIDAEKHLVGYQVDAITVHRVYLNGVLKTVGLGNDYTISTQFIDGKTHTEIHWEAGVNPTADDRVSCDVTYGSRRPVEAIRYFLENFADYESSIFNTDSYNEATAKETSRGYTFAGMLWQTKPKKVLRTILDEWRFELELDIFSNKNGEVCFKYISAVIGSPNKYSDLREILKPFNSEPKVLLLLNKLKFGERFHYSKTYFYNYDTYEDVSSQTKYDRVYDDFAGYYWIRDPDMARDISSRKVIRFKDPVTFDTFRLPLKTFNDDLGDVLKITHFEGKGSEGYVDKLFQIRSMELDLDNFINTIVMEDATNFIGNTCILGSRLALPLLYINAVGAQKDYCFACDWYTKKFSNGEDGKLLMD